MVKKVKLPYNVNSFSQLAAYYVLKYKKYIDKNIKLIIEERERMKSVLEGLYYFPESKANFIFFKINNIESIKKEFKKNGICVRYFKGPRLKNYARITIGRPEENNKIIDILKKGF
jgi:histidinol-phosphate aminotransferase